MKRAEKLARMGLCLPQAANIRVIIDTDAKNEADDQYAILHHLLTPQFDVRGIVAAHFESKAAVPGETMEQSYREIVRLLALAEMDDVPALRGCALPLASPGDAPDSDGVRFLIAEARRDDARPLYVAALGAATNIAAALNRAPDIAARMTVLWNGGGSYTVARREFNLAQDADACRCLLQSGAAVWQIPWDVYRELEVSVAELAHRVRPCGAVGRYLYDQLVAQNLRDCGPGSELRRGGNWTLGDNATVAVLLSTPLRGGWITRPAPRINASLGYTDDPAGKPIRVYTRIDTRLTLEDFYAKLALAYGVR